MREIAKLRNAYWNSINFGLGVSDSSYRNATFIQQRVWSVWLKDPTFLGRIGQNEYIAILICEHEFGHSHIPISVLQKESKTWLSETEWKKTIISASFQSVHHPISPFMCTDSEFFLYSVYAVSNLQYKIASQFSRNTFHATQNAHTTHTHNKSTVWRMPTFTLIGIGEREKVFCFSFSFKRENA